MFILPYKAGSKSAKELSEELSVKRIKARGSRFKGRPDKTVINWGGSTVTPEVDKCQVLNKPEAVAKASNKLSCFQHIEQVCNVPAFSTDPNFAREALAEGVCLVARTVLNGNSGAGIVIMEKPEDFVEAPLYVKYEKKVQEYRIHVAGGQVIGRQRKARSRDVPDEQVNWKVRNVAGGFIFARNEEHMYPVNVCEEAVKAVNILGLDFGAVDIIWNKDGVAFVLEVNTAPGLAGSTVKEYGDYFRGLM